MELVTRQYERPGHQQRLLQTFTEDVFIFSLLVYIYRALELSGRRALQIYLLTYLLTYLLGEDVSLRLVRTVKFCDFFEGGLKISKSKNVMSGMVTTGTRKL